MRIGEIRSFFLGQTAGEKQTLKRSATKVLDLVFSGAEERRIAAGRADSRLIMSKNEILGEMTYRSVCGGR
jgi:hypothetical protein